MLTLYKILSFCIYPILPLVLRVRQAQGKEDKLRKKEKLAKIKVSRPKGKVIWLHCASVGEANSSLPLIEKLLNRDKKLHILMTTGTLTSANLMAKKLPKRSIHSFAPLDAPQIVNRFLNHWQPNSIIWLESEIWPNILLEIKKRNIPCASLNAIISDKSYAKWQKHPKMINKILSAFSVVVAQTDKKGKMLSNLGAKNVKCLGNLKATLPAPAVDKDKKKELEKAIGKRKILCFSSTHKGEEELAISTHKLAKKKEKNLLTIILPRHPNRRDEIKSLLEKSGLNFAFRSEGKLPEKNNDIYVADTMGEVGTFYSICPIVFMGGSMSPYHDGGHNPIEPAKFGCAVVSGNKISSFEEIFDSLKKSCIIVKSEKALQKNMISLLFDNKKVESLSKEALKAVGGENTILEDIINELIKIKVA